MPDLLAEDVLYIAVNITFAFFTIITNGLILVTVYKTPSLQNPSNYFICSLAANDIVVGLFINTNNAVIDGLRLWHSKHALRKMEQFFYVQTIVSSALNLCVVSMDRYIAVSKPLRYPSIMTDQKCFRIISVIWIISILWGFPAALLDGKTGIFTLWAVVLIGGYLVPLAVIVFSYVGIMRIAHYQQCRIATSVHMKRTFAENQYTNVTVQNVRSRRAATTFALITLVFVVTFTPDLVIAIYHAIRGHQKGKQREMLLLWLNFLLYTSSAINPVIYGFRNRELRVAAKKLVFKRNS